MSDNATAKDAAGADVTFRTRDRGGIQTAVQAASFEGDDGSEQLVKPSNPMPSTDASAQAKLDALLTAVAALTLAAARESTLAKVASAADPDLGKVVVGNIRDKWKCGFQSLAIFSQFFSVVSQPAGDLVFADGNVAGASWVDVCKSALVADDAAAGSVYLARKAFRVPYALEFGISLSQRVQSQEFYVEMVGVSADSDGNVQSVLSTVPAVADNPVAGSITVASNTWTIPLANDTPLLPGDWICIGGAADSRLNIGPVQITNLNSAVARTIHVSSTLSDGTFTGTAGATVRFLCRAGGADYQHGLCLYGASASNADLVSRNGSDSADGNLNRPRVAPWNPGNTITDAAVPNEGINYAGLSYTRSFRPKGLFRGEHATGHLQWNQKSQDSTTPSASQSFRESEVPAQDRWYALRFRALNLPCMSAPVGSSLAVTAISKAGSTTWTLIVPGHGLTAADRVAYYGAAYPTSFPNITTAVAPTIVDANTIQITGATGTASSYGGVVIRVNGNAAIPTIQTVVVQSFAKSYDSRRLILNGNGTWTETVGNVITLVGLVTVGGVVQTQLHGRYRVARISTTVLEADPLEGQAAAIAAISGTLTAGGAVIRNTSFRLHYARILDFVRMLTEPASVNGNGSRSSPVFVNGGSLTANLTAVASATPVTMVGQGASNRALGVALAAPASNAEVTSSARTANGNSGTISDEGAGGNLGALITLTANGGTTPTLDIVLKESMDNGATWRDIWHCERLTTVNTTVAVPALPIGGRRRWDWTITGASASYTFKIDAMRSFGATFPLVRQYYDRTAGLLSGTASTAGIAFDIAGLKSVTGKLTCAAVTTGGVYNLQISDDGVAWSTASADVTAVANATVLIPMTAGLSGRQARLWCKTAGSSQTGTLASISGSN